MKEQNIDLYKELKKYFGFSQFKGLQEKVVTSIISGNNTFVIMPTGGGKSLCYQLPALVLEGTAIVVSPLIALMKNQVDAIRSMGSDVGVAHVLNSSLNKTEVNQVKADILSGKTFGRICTCLQSSIILYPYNLQKNFWDSGGILFTSL